MAQPNTLICTVGIEYVVEDPPMEVRTTQVVYELDQEPRFGVLHLPIFAVLLSICAASATHISDAYRIFTCMEGSWVCHGTKAEILRVDRPHSKRYPATTTVGVTKRLGTSMLDTLRVVMSTKAEVCAPPSSSSGSPTAARPTDPELVSYRSLVNALLQIPLRKGELLFRQAQASKSPESKFIGKIQQNSVTKVSPAPTKISQTTSTNPKPRSSYLPARDAKPTSATSSTGLSTTTVKSPRLAAKSSVGPTPSATTKDMPRWQSGRALTSSTTATTASRKTPLVSSVSERPPRATPPAKTISAPKEPMSAKSRSTPLYSTSTATARLVCEQCGQVFVRAEGLRRHNETVTNCATVKKRVGGGGRVAVA